MSSYVRIINNIEEIVQSFISNVSEKYNIPEEELKDLFFGENKTTLTKSEKKSETKKVVKQDALSVNVEDLSIRRLQNSSKIELQGLCKIYKHKVTGTKQQLIDRLLGTTTLTTSKRKNSKSDSVENIENIENTENIKTQQQVKTSIVICEDDEDDIEINTESITKNKKITAPKKSTIIEKIKSTQNNVSIRENSHGNLVHPPTELVFNTDGFVIGKQLDDGKIADLTDEDIDQCKKYKFKFTVPESLENVDTFHNKKISDINPIVSMIENAEKENKKNESEDELEEVEEDEELEEEDLENELEEEDL